MVNQVSQASSEYLDKCKKILLRKRVKIEEAIKKIGEQLNSVHRKDYDKEGSDFHEESERTEALYNLSFAELKKVNVRISEIEKGTFRSLCPKCGKAITGLLRHPLRNLCVVCQKTENKNNNKK